MWYVAGVYWEGRTGEKKGRRDEGKRKGRDGRERKGREGRKAGKGRGFTRCVVGPQRLALGSVPFRCVPTAHLQEISQDLFIYFIFLKHV